MNDTTRDDARDEATRAVQRSLDRRGQGAAPPRSDRQGAADPQPGGANAAAKGTATPAADADEPAT